MPTTNQYIQPNTTPTAPAAAPAGSQSISQLFGQVNQQQLIAVANSYGGSYAQQNFISNPANITALTMAYEVYGMPVAYPGNWYRDQYGWCATWESLNNFWQLAILFLKYPRPAKTENNCLVLKSYIENLDLERLAIEQKYVIDNEPCGYKAGLKAVNDLQGIYRGMYSSMTCDVVIANQTAEQQQNQAEEIQENTLDLQIKAQQAQAAIAAAAAEKAAALQQQNAGNIANIAGTGNKGTNTYLVYGIIGGAVLLMVGAVVIFKNKTA